MKEFHFKCEIEDHEGGWDKKNFALSWFKEKISREEFFRRLNQAKVFHRYSGDIERCSCVKTEQLKGKKGGSKSAMKYGPVYTLGAKDPRVSQKVNENFKGELGSSDVKE